MLERDYYIHLNSLKEQGEVKSIELQPKYTLIERFKRNGKTFRPTTYTADFRVVYKNGREEVLDTKGVVGDVFRIKQKLLELQNPEINFYIVKKENHRWVKKR